VWSEAPRAEQRHATPTNQSTREDQDVQAFGRLARGEMSRKVILLVEDNPDDELLTLRALRKTGVQNEVVVAHDGVEALDYLFASGPHAGRDPAAVPQLVLLDLKLPKVGGLEVLKRLRSDERTRRLPVVILSSSREQRDMLDGYGFGANSYVRKPVNFEQFVKAVELLRRYWLVLNEDPPVV
jgi:two-component system response regulator